MRKIDKDKPLKLTTSELLALDVSKAKVSILSSLLSIFMGLVLGMIIMLIVKPESSFGGLATILTGGFQDGAQSFGNVLHYSTPLILAGLSVGFAFKAGLFNIGGAGQIVVGGFVAIYIGVKWTWLPSEIHWIVAMLGAGLAGALWASVPGLLKAYRNVHEVVATIMMNYIGMYLVLILIKGSVYNSDKNETVSVPRAARLPRWGLDKIFEGSYVSAGIIIAIIVSIIIYIIIFKTTLGYQLRMVGHNRHAAKYAGVNEKRNIVYSMLIAGALAGLAGGTIYLSPAGRHIEIVSQLVSEGFDGIAVALLGMSHPLGVLFAGFFFGYIKTGGFYMQSWGFDEEIINIIIASIIYFSALALIFRTKATQIILLFGKWFRNIFKKEKPKDKENRGDLDEEDN
ncbi:MAG: ABC transporter permease [Candidatus Izemoplasmatales bacterium]